MINVHGETFAEVYSKLRAHLLVAEEVKPRGMATRELSPAHFTITNPRARLGYHPDRKLSIPFAVADAVMLFDPSNKLKYLSYFNANLANFSDNGVTMNSMYGSRIQGQMEEVLNKLRHDPDTRQAVMPIVRAGDHEHATKDFPCTMALNFLIRSGKLHMHAYMRSNDLFWGTPYDVFNFTVIQEVFANTLGLELGEYHHTATSLHVYEKHYDMLENIETMESVEFAVPMTYEQIRMDARLVKSLIDGYSISAGSDDFAKIIMNAYSSKRMTGLEDWEKERTPEWAKQFVAGRWKL